MALGQGIHTAETALFGLQGLHESHETVLALQDESDFRLFAHGKFRKPQNMEAFAL